MRTKEVRKLGIIEVEKGLCTCNYVVNPFIGSTEYYATEYDNHKMTDNYIFHLLGEVRKVVEEKTAYKVFITEYTGFYIYFPKPKEGK